MTQGKLSVANKAPGTEGQQQVHGEKKEAPAVPSAPPSYEEATSGEGMKAGAFPPAPTAVPLHPSWAYVDPSSSSSYDNGFPTGDHELFTTFSWDDQKVRRVFVRKVYTILLIQLLVTLAVVALFTFCDPVKNYIQANPGWYWASYAVFFATYLTLACCSGPRRHFPWNLILLTVFTLSMAYLTGMLSVPWLHAVYAALGAGVFTLFLALDTQLLMGNRRHSLSPEEYIFGALNIYLDIIYIFTFFLQLFGTNRE
uniref:Protein lifeguard 2 n=1 Tax=Nomascus leucogenys TaxID=61853 RepID=G1S802_NOMLE